DLAELGHPVVGVDVSPTMIELARAAGPSMRFELADATTLPMDVASADLAVLFMSLQDIDDMPGAVRAGARVLEPGGRLCIAIVHPINSAGHFDAEEAESPFTIRGSYLEVHRTVDTVERDGVTMTFHSEHRPLDAYSRALEAAGFLIEAIREHA